MAALAIIIVGGFVLAFALFKAMWRVAEPNEALIISGLRQHTPSDAVQESLGFKIVTGRGVLVIPGVRPSGSCRLTSARPSWESTASPTRAYPSGCGAW